MNALHILIVVTYLLISCWTFGSIIETLSQKKLTFAFYIGIGYVFFVYLIPLSLSSVLPYSIISKIHIFLNGIFLILAIFLNKKSFSKKKIKYYLGFITVVFTFVFIFLIPSFCNSTGGIFTEGGGDLTIYGSLSNKMPDDSLMTGPNWSNFYKLITKTGTVDETPIPNNIGYSGNPPFPGWTNYRMHKHVGTSFYPNGWFSPMAYLSYVFPNFSIAIIYFSVLAFIFSGILLLFIQFAWDQTQSYIASFTSVIIPLFSHGLIYIGYNHYYLAWTSLYFSVLSTFLILKNYCNINYTIILIQLGIFTSIFIVYWPGFPFYFIPFILICFFVKAKFELNDKKLGVVFLSSVLLLSISLSVPFLYKSILNLWKFILAGTGNLSLTYLGAPRQLLSLEFIPALLGYFQLGNIPPYSSADLIEANWFKVSWMLGGLISFAIFLYILFLNKDFFLKKIFVIFSIFIGASYYVGRGTEYTQFKAFSYCLALIFIFYSLVVTHFYKNKKIIISLLLLAVTFALPRVFILNEMLQEKQRTSNESLNFEKLLDKLNPTKEKIFVIMLPTSSALYTLDLMLSKHKYFFAIGMYYSYYGGSAAGFFSKFGMNQFIYLERNKEKIWQAVNYTDRLKQKEFDVLGPYYDGQTAVDVEVVFSPNTNYQIDLNPGDLNQANLVSIWNNETLSYQALKPNSIKDKNLQIYNVKTNESTSFFKIKGRNIIKITKT